MDDHLDLDAYFDRIGYCGDTVPTLETLSALVFAHVKTIPFENLDVLLGRPVRLDAASLRAKLIDAGRGGYCFEHNTLLAGALREIGFAVTGLAARVVMNRASDAPLPRTHMLLMVEAGGERMIVDAGFGGLTLTGPLRLDADGAQETPHEPFRLTGDEKGYRLEALVGGIWTPLYAFDLAAQFAPDFEMMNHYTATHPESVFRHMLAAARVTDSGRYGLRDNVLSVHRTGAPSERHVLETGAAIRDALVGAFGIALPDDPGLGAAFDRFAGSGPR